MNKPMPAGRPDNAGATRPVIGVSRCLLGDAVRYDGKAKPHRFVLDTLSRRFSLYPVCPEVEAGLGVPRPPVQLCGDPLAPRLTGRDDPALDITNTLDAWCRQKLATLPVLHGFVCKSRSPSCGLRSTPVFSGDDCISETGRGIFARRLCERFPELPVIEETGLDDATQSSHFLAAVEQYFHRQRR